MRTTRSCLDCLAVLDLLDKRRWSLDILSENVSLAEPRKPLGSLIFEKDACRDREDLCRGGQQTQRNEEPKA